MACRNAAANGEDEDVDIGVPALPFLAEDPVAQDVVLRTMISYYDEKKTERDFLRSPVTRTKLSQLKEIYERGNRTEQINLLRRRRQVEIDAQYIKQGTDNMVAYNTKSGAVDYLLCIPRKAGLSALLPNSDVDIARVWKMTARGRQRRFKAKHARLGFDAAECMLYVGTLANEDVWVAFPPREFFDEGAEALGDQAVGMDSDVDSRMSSGRCRQVLVFFAYLFAQQYVEDITVSEPHTWPQEILSDADFDKITNLR